jgi:hypothetical protein
VNALGIPPGLVLAEINQARTLCQCDPRNNQPGNTMCLRLLPALRALTVKRLKVKMAMAVDPQR